jgi:hypothetical protein
MNISEADLVAIKKERRKQIIRDFYLVLFGLAGMIVSLYLYELKLSGFFD